METNNILREALVSVKKSIDDMGAASLNGDPGIMLMSLTQVCARLSARIEAALAEPVKNCEVGTAMEQGERFSAYCRAHKHPESECLICPLFGQTGGYCELAWAQLPYVEAKGEAK